MKERYTEIKQLNAMDEASTAEKLCKLFEEVGELAQATNKTIGRKITESNPDDIRDEVLDEAADTIQCVISLIDDYDITYEELIDRIKFKNTKWKSVIVKRRER